MLAAFLALGVSSHLATISTALAQKDGTTVLARTPPMGWNSWDAYGESVSEADIRANAQWMAQNLKSHGWEYIVVDMGWYITNHTGESNAKNSKYSLDEFGRFTPATNSIPSANSSAGFKPLADYVHSLGLKFGIHILRGIPKQAVDANLPVEGSSFHAADAADRKDTCPWNPFNYGVDPAKPAGQAYYDSIARLYAQWGVDFLKVDCISSHPYKGEDIRMIREALDKTGRAIVLSLSPGPAPLDKAREIARYAQLWRISDDVWDVWKTTENFPQGPGNQFARTAAWAVHSGPGHWPDADMLPLGSLRPSAGWGESRETRLTKEEQRSLLTLWCIVRSPLIMGGNLTALQTDPWTTSLLTNDEVLAVDQHSKDSRAAIQTENSAVWVSRPAEGPGYYVAVFNLSDQPQTLQYHWTELGLAAGRYKVHDLWEHQEAGPIALLKVNLSPHASTLYKIIPQ
ncbi:MAG: alpha-galactosidase [Acidobacteria bacterium]|nr:MAG: alpha-galactosidase [Acidobacteriota bacterium]